MIFSVQVIQGMRRIGVEVTETEAEDYYYVWRVAGSMLGIRTAIIPDTLADAEEFSRDQVESTYGPSPDGVALTRGLLDLYEKLVPGTVFDGVVAAMVRQVVDPDVADWLQVPKSRGRAAPWRRRIRALFPRWCRLRWPAGRSRGRVRRGSRRRRAFLRR